MCFLLRSRFGPLPLDSRRGARGRMGEAKRNLSIVRLWRVVTCLVNMPMDTP
jgi:hypothetical protein